MDGDSGENADLYEKLAELARANVAGPMGYKLVAQAQRDLVNKMTKKGLLTEDDAQALKM